VLVAALCLGIAIAALVCWAGGSTTQSSRRSSNEQDDILDRLRRKQQQLAIEKNTTTSCSTQDGGLHRVENHVPKAMEVAMRSHEEDLPFFPATSPIRSIEDMNEEAFSAACAPCDYTTPCEARKGPFPCRSRLIVCHDYKGNYHQDRFLQGGIYTDGAFRIYRWELIDIFVYFSHWFITIPPRPWITVAHRHGTRVLGTFITELDKGKEYCRSLFSSEVAAKRLSKYLCSLAVTHGFEGWLIDIENDVDTSLLPNLRHFMGDLQLRIKQSVPEGRGYVIWYDSVTNEGTLQWQNRLNKANSPWFDLCDGILINYSWEAHFPASSAAIAGLSRRWDCYFGIDVFGRNSTWGGGGWQCPVALSRLANAGVSAALFAPAWIMEHELSLLNSSHDYTKLEADFAFLDEKFWGVVAGAWWPARPQTILSLPLGCNFDAGVGQGTMWLAGKPYRHCHFSSLAGDENEKHTPHYFLSAQSLLPGLLKRPFLGSASVCWRSKQRDRCLTCRYIVHEGFDGSGCLEIEGKLSQGDVGEIGLYNCSVPCAGDPWEIIFCTKLGEHANIALQLELHSVERDDACYRVILRKGGVDTHGSTRKVSKRLTCTSSSYSFAPVSVDVLAGKWQWRRYVITDLGLLGRRLQKTSVVCTTSKHDGGNASQPFRACIGFMSIGLLKKRGTFPTASNVTAKDCAQIGTTMRCTLCWQVEGADEMQTPVSHCDIWGEFDDQFVERKWLARAYVGSFSARCSWTASETKALTAVIQVVDEMGHRQPLESAARIVIL
jgi:hypothetical protein